MPVTAGTWHRLPSDSGSRIVGGRGNIADRIMEPADAELIAAAPELLSLVRAWQHLHASDCACSLCAVSRMLMARIASAG